MKTGALFIVLFCLLWAGMVAAISFLEAPVKFTAPGLTLRIGLDVGRHVFGAFNKVEIALGGLLLALVLVTRLTAVVRILLGCVFVILLLECIWLLPVLDKRALIIIAGGWPKDPSPHGWYILFEALKFLLLVATGIYLLAGVFVSAKLNPDKNHLPR